MMSESNSRIKVVAIAALSSALAAFAIGLVLDGVNYLNRTSDSLPITNNFLLLTGAFVCLIFLFLVPWAVLRTLRKAGRITIQNPENAAGGAAIAFALSSGIPDIIFRRQLAAIITDAAWHDSMSYKVTAVSIGFVACIIGAWTALILAKKDRSIAMIVAAILAVIPLSIIESRIP